MIETLKKGVRYRTTLKKLTNGLPKGSPSRPRSYLNANRQSDSFTSLEIRPRKIPTTFRAAPNSLCSGGDGELGRNGLPAPIQV